MKHKRNDDSDDAFRHFCRLATELPRIKPAQPSEAPEPFSHPRDESKQATDDSQPEAEQRETEEPES